MSESNNDAMRERVAILGDVHGDWSVVVAASVAAKAQGAVALIQVGDMGWSAKLLGRAMNVPASLPVYAIDGNHEAFDWLRVNTQGRTTQLAPNLTFVGRGDVKFIGGWRIAFLGGAESVDKKWRKTRMQAPEVSGEYLWFPDERIDTPDVTRLLGIGDVDLFITHTPPDTIIRRHFPASGLLMFDIDPRTWIDPSALAVEGAWERLGKPPLYCGHMHRSVRDESSRVTILDINEMLLVDNASHRAVPTSPSLPTEPQKGL